MLGLNTQVMPQVRNSDDRTNTPTFKTLTWPAHNKALKRRGSLSIRFEPDLAEAAVPTRKRGRQPPVQIDQLGATELGWVQVAFTCCMIQSRMPGMA